VEIILITFNLPDKEKECIDSVKKFTDLNKHTLTIYDNYPKKENLAVVWNRLIENSKEDIICLLNNDTVVEKGWDRMIEVLKDPKVGAVGPVTNNCGGRQKNMSKNGKVEEINDLSGFCYCFRKSVWEEVGRFPEDMPFYGQESIFNLKLKDHGYKLMVDRRVYVHHHKAQSYKKAIENKEITNEEQVRGAFHYWNYVERLKKLRTKIPQGTKLAIYGVGDGFPLHRGMKQTLSDFFGKNGLGILTADNWIDTLNAFNPDIYITNQTKHDQSWDYAKKLKERGVKTALYFNDLRSPDQKGIWEMDWNLPEYFDAVFVCAKEYADKKWDLPVYHLPQATIQIPKPIKGDKHRIVHIGDLQTEYHQHRREIVNNLEFTNLNETNREKRIALSHKSPEIYHGSDFCLSVSHDVKGYTSDRLYNILGAGGCAIAFNPGDIPFEHKKHLYWFRTPEEFKKIIQESTPEERDAIKEEAFKEVQSKHLHKDRIIELLLKL
jgi:GT2 family glycosyltransferase